jgi:hypothetical protein
MIRRQIEIDEETDRKLAGIAEDYDGDVGMALASLVAQHDDMEALLDESESANQEFLLKQKERSEKGFREGRFTTWEEVKRRNNL